MVSTYLTYGPLDVFMVYCIDEYNTMLLLLVTNKGGVDFAKTFTNHGVSRNHRCKLQTKHVWQQKTDTSDPSDSCDNSVWLSCPAVPRYTFTTTTPSPAYLTNFLWTPVTKIIVKKAKNGDFQNFIVTVLFVFVQGYNW